MLRRETERCFSREIAAVYTATFTFRDVALFRFLHPIFSPDESTLSIYTRRGYYAQSEGGATAHLRNV